MKIFSMKSGSVAFRRIRSVDRRCPKIRYDAAPGNAGPSPGTGLSSGTEAVSPIPPSEVSRLCQDLDALLPAEAARRSFPTGRLYDLIRYRGVRRSGKSNDALLVDKTPEHSFRLP